VGAKKASSTDEVKHQPMQHPKMRFRNKASACNSRFIIVAVLLSSALTLGFSWLQFFEAQGGKLARAQAVTMDSEGSNQGNPKLSLPEATLQLRGGGQVTSCLGGNMGPNIVVPEPEEPKPEPPKKSATSIGFFSDIGRKANGILKFGSESKIDVTVGTVQKGMRVTGSMMHSILDGKGDKVAIKGEGVKGKYGYWVGADTKQNIEGGLAVKNKLGDSKKLDLYLSTKLPTKSLEAEGVYSSPKIVPRSNSSYLCVKSITFFHFRMLHLEFQR